VRSVPDVGRAFRRRLKAGVVIADATDRLLRATKKKILREKGNIDYSWLAKEGYSRDLIARLKAL
jgi:hypothetical protein